jgi:hypothetical protein
LFLLSSLLDSLTAVRQVVFCNDLGQFLGMATPAALVDSLAKAFSTLDDFMRDLHKQGNASDDIDREINRQTQAWHRFVRSPSSGTVPVSSSPIDETELKVGIRLPLLERWLGERWVGRCIRVDTELSMSQVQQIVDSLLPDVPVQRLQKDLPPSFELLVVDRDAFALELAREWVRSSMPRSGVR